MVLLLTVGLTYRERADPQSRNDAGQGPERGFAKLRDPHHYIVTQNTNIFRWYNTIL